MTIDEIIDEMEDRGAEAEDAFDNLQQDEELYREFLQRFIENENILHIREAAAARDAERASNEVHTLKGCAGYVGLLPIVDLCTMIRSDFMDGNTDEAFAQLDELDQCFTEWAEFIRSAIA